MSRELASHRWPELTDRTLLAIPLGATEQHGPHLPLWTDTAIATELCNRLAAERNNLVIGPAIPYGASGEHAAFPGTLSIGHDALRLLLLELVRSADHFAGVVVVNGHGGNLPALHSAEELLHYEGRSVLTWSPTGRADDSHAGHTETSVMLALHPENVHFGQASAGNTTALPDLMPHLREGGVRAVSANGVLGDPTAATADEGRDILSQWTNSLTNAVRHWENSTHDSR
ncbi:mycofactocin biosynthesis peptidyl-dipeptidase MftE [Saccharopolyspora sp. SCSIO 74807]|uniref:mycofactocin biosynthesis peptidyl-dipeptidase MftE n=1 Tax=Saccharopolyspora sp. SCSIO 74807 TaxID=3118084 RepID=UPI0030CD339E